MPYRTSDAFRVSDATMYRKDLMNLLLQRPWTLGELARSLEEDARRLEDDLQHLLRSLRRGDTKVRVEPAECRKCHFLFRADSLLKPSKCPKCRGTWILEARLSLHAKGDTAPSNDEAGSARHQPGNAEDEDSPR